MVHIFLIRAIWSPAKQIGSFQADMGTLYACICLNYIVDIISSIQSFSGIKLVAGCLESAASLLPNSFNIIPAALKGYKIAHMYISNISVKNYSCKC